jgi:hypothetical protein
MQRRGGSRVRSGAAAFALAAAIAVAAPAALAAGSDASGGGSPVPNGPVPDDDPKGPGYQAVGPSERRGRTIDLNDAEATPGVPQPASGGGSPNDFPGESRTLEEMSRRPGPDRKKADWEIEDVPGPLKIRRLPGTGPPADAPLLVRLCDAEDSHAFAERELRDAVRAYKRARRGEYPRGRDKWLVLTRRDIAVRRAARADADRAALLVEAEAAHLDFESNECP